MSRALRARPHAGAAVLIAVALASASARADNEDALRAVDRGDCAEAGSAINDGMGRDDPQSYYLAGYLYAWTGCVKEDLPRAVRYLERAVELGSEDAAVLLGMMHGIGYGVPQDYRTAYRWFTRVRREPVATTLDVAAETAYGYARTVQQVAARRVVYPRSFEGRREGTLFVTMHTGTGVVEYASRGADGTANPDRLNRAAPFMAAIDRAFAEAFAMVPRTPGFPTEDYVFETPWKFVLR